MISAEMSLDQVKPRVTPCRFRLSDDADRKPGQHVRPTVASSLERLQTRKGHAESVVLTGETKPRDSAMNNLSGMSRIVVPTTGSIRPRAQWKWLGEADRWNDLADREIGSRLQKNPMHAGPMAMAMGSPMSCPEPQ